MRDVRGDPPLRLQTLLQRLPHGVHGAREVVRLVPYDPADRVPHPYVRLTARDLVGGGRGLAQPARQPAPDEHAERAAAEDDRDGADHQGLVQVLEDVGAAVGEPGVQGQHIAVLGRYGGPDVRRPARPVRHIGRPAPLLDLVPQRQRQRRVVLLDVGEVRQTGLLVVVLGDLDAFVGEVAGVVQHRDPGGVVHDQTQRDRDQRADQRDGRAELPSQSRTDARTLQPRRDQAPKNPPHVRLAQAFNL